MYVIGVTGGICSGKSTVVQLLEEKGVQVLDADKLGHEAYEPGTDCFNLLVNHFGSDIVSDGKINRKALGSIVFSNPDQMKSLQGIVWPEIRRLINDRIDAFKAQGVEIVALEAAVMIEAGWYDIADELWVVVVERDVAVNRMIERNSVSEEDALKRINSQLSNTERCEHATVVINNNTASLSELHSIVDSIYKSALERYQQKK